jgi:SAM-dependent methyltransferase
VDYSSLVVPHHLTAEILSHFPKATNRGCLALDIGCGPAIHRGVCEQAGFEYVGLDYESLQATLLGDAHALPFRADSFEFVLSIAMLHLVQFPWLVAREACRVLTPGGRFIGTVAFLEPFHATGYYHHTHLGILSSLLGAGLRVDLLGPIPHWTVLRAQAEMSLFPGMPRRLARTIVWPLEMLHRAWWARVARFDPDPYRRVRNTAGSFAFVATKE